MTEQMQYPDRLSAAATPGVRVTFVDALSRSEQGVDSFAKSSLFRRSCYYATRRSTDELSVVATEPQPRHSI